METDLILVLDTHTQTNASLLLERDLVDVWRVLIHSIARRKTQRYFARHYLEAKEEGRVGIVCNQKDSDCANKTSSK